MALQQLARPFETDESSANPVGAALARSAMSERPLRLRLSSSIGHGALDGAWWPYSRDLAAEAVQLADQFPTSFDRIFRIVYSTPDWESCPRRVKAGGGFINLGSFPRDDTHVVMLRSAALGRRPVPQLLLVVPPDIDSRAAEHVMRIAAMPSNSKSAAIILGESRDQYRVSLLSHWDDDGGAYADA